MQDTFQTKIQKALEISDPDQFVLSEHIICGDECILCVPTHIGVKWTNDNKYLRSVVYRKRDFFPISLSFMKFTNWGENPENFPVPTSLKDTHITEKLDGSLLIVTNYKGNYMLRTRGTVDAHKLDNGHELEIFERDILPIIGAGGKDTWGFSLLFEWVSPLQRIILNYGDTPQWYLVGCVQHEDYRLETQASLNQWAAQHGLKRPPVYTFPTVEDLISGVELWKGKEGVCVYSNEDQTIHKVKGMWYLALHRMKESLASIDKVIDVWFEQGQPSYQEFEKFIVGNFDWELWTQCRGDASRICDGHKEVKQIMLGMNVFVDQVLGHLPTRKEQAEKVISSYGKTNRASFVFKLLDKKPLALDDQKKLLYQVLKK